MPVHITDPTSLSSAIITTAEIQGDTRQGFDMQTEHSGLGFRLNPDEMTVEITAANTNGLHTNELSVKFTLGEFKVWMDEANEVIDLVEVILTEAGRLKP